MIRLILTILPLYIETIPIALYVSVVGGSVSVPLGHWVGGSRYVVCIKGAGSTLNIPSERGKYSG